MYILILTWMLFNGQIHTGLELDQETKSGKRLNKEECGELGEGYVDHKPKNVLWVTAICQKVPDLPNAPQEQQQEEKGTINKSWKDNT